MTTARRTDAYRLRQTISAMLEQADALEYAMELFHRRGNPAELDRAAASYDTMLAHVDQLGELLRTARHRQNAVLVAETTS
jgi:hypothetical protein